MRASPTTSISGDAFRILFRIAREIRESSTNRTRIGIGCWLLVVGCWLLVSGCWLLVVSCWLLVVSCWLLVKKILNASCTPPHKQQTTSNKQQTT
ncbi:MAG TPA: hypothetical protein DC064_02085, partial [Cyanobacteria bacterium UBA9273]|nr:hypothetical protein [Cyanobacteria bacterium UBA9273]